MSEQTQPSGTRQRAKVAWLNDYQVFGGSESTQKRLLNIAPRKVDFLTPTTFWTGYDLYILNNIRGFTGEQIEYVLGTKLVTFWHDVLYEDADLIKEICDKSSVNIFLSPLHLNTFQQKFGIIVKDAYVIPPLFDKELPKSNGNRKGICWFGSIWPHKGVESTLLWARNNKVVIDFYGDGNPLLVEQLKTSKYANYKGKASKEVLVNYKYFIHMPDEIEAFGRAAFEAYLAGCHILHNEKIGAFSYNWIDYQDKQSTLTKLNDLGVAFWSIIQV